MTAYVSADPSKVDPEAAIPPKLRTGRFLGLSQAAIPYFMALSDCIGGLGASFVSSVRPTYGVLRPSSTQNHQIDTYVN